MMRRIGRHRGYFAVTPYKKKEERVKPKSARQEKTERIERWATNVLRRYEGMMGDWAVSGMTAEERDLYIGGDNALYKKARESIEDGLCDAMIQMGVPLDIVHDVRREVLRRTS